MRGVDQELKSALDVVILAAGQGTRMRSSLPKVLHPLGGVPMLLRVIQTAQTLNPCNIHIIIGYEADTIRAALPDLKVNWVMQKEQLGTGHAVQQALPHITHQSQVLILSADVPLIQSDSLHHLLACQSSQQEGVTLLLATVPQPEGLGRIVRNLHREIEAIVEEKDASAEVREIKEIYSGICCVSANLLHRWLPELSSNNAQKEYYLTEIISMAIADKRPVTSLHAHNVYEIMGVNTRQQLQTLERIWQRLQADKLMLNGVTLADASRIDMRGPLDCGKDVFIDVNNVFIGHVVIGEGTRIAPNCVLKEVTIGKHCEILANSVLENCHIGDGCHVGPFARLRPGTRLADSCKIGNFVETKNAVFATGSKASHLSYLGDVTIGKDVNLGAGTITCNYDGVNKHQTIIEDEAFIGSDTQLVAPVTIGAGATIGAGSTIRKNVPAGELTLTESRQKTIYGWRRPEKRR